jgi:hypothetical protein
MAFYYNISFKLPYGGFLDGCSQEKDFKLEKGSKKGAKLFCQAEGKGFGRVSQLW